MNLEEMIERVAEYGGGTPAVWYVGEDAHIQLADRCDGSPLLAGATITNWVPDDDER